MLRGYTPIIELDGHVWKLVQTYHELDLGLDDGQNENGEAETSPDEPNGSVAAPRRDVS